MVADIPELNSAQHGIAQGMDEDISIGMGNGAFVVFNGNTAQQKAFPFSQPVHIVPISNPDWHHRRWFLKDSKSKESEKRKVLSSGLFRTVGIR